MFNQYKKLWIVLAVLIILCPLGLIATGTAFGEWGADQLNDEVGFIPVGFAHWADTWSNAPLADYALPGGEESTALSIGGYILSALIGVALVSGIMALFYKVVDD